MNKRALFRMKGNDVEFAVVAPLWALSDLDVSADKVTAELVPLGDKSFEVIACHAVSSMVANVQIEGRAAFGASLSNAVLAANLT
jgi:hypothetical protein